MIPKVKTRMFITQLLSNPIAAILYIIAIVIAVSLHEFAHAYIADRLGDPTPRMQGRLTPNPRAHLDPYGSLLFLLAGFGWGKPVVFDPFNLRNPRRDAASISFAGPAINLILAGIAALLLRLFLQIPLPFSPFGVAIGLAVQFLETFTRINVLLAIFNLVPIHPLDGFKIVGGLLSERKAREWYQLQPYGMFFLIILLFFPFSGSSYLQNLISPPITFILRILLPQVAVI